MTSRTVLLGLVLTLLPLAHLQAQEISASDQALLERLVVAEAGGEGTLGMALVARSVLNRVSLLRSNTLSTGTYLARGRSIPGVINGRLQYEPVSSGTIRRRRSAAQLRQARSAIALARDTSALRAALRARGVSAAQIDRLLRATGFRTQSAYRDRSQNYDRTVFGNHVFNSDRFSRRHDVTGLFERYYATDSSAATATSREPTRSIGIAGALAAIHEESPTGPTSAPSTRRSSPASAPSTRRSSPASARTTSPASGRSPTTAPASARGPRSSSWIPSALPSARASSLLARSSPTPADATRVRTPTPTEAYRDGWRAWQDALARAETPRGATALSPIPSPNDSPEVAAFRRLMAAYGPLRLGSRGPGVARLQGAIGVDETSFFGVATLETLLAWQRARNLEPTGEVDVATYTLLRSRR